MSLVEPSGPQTQNVQEGGELNLGGVVIVYRAKLLDEGKVTPINLTQVSDRHSFIVPGFLSCIFQHWGFNLEASLKDVPEPSLSVKDHALSIKVCSLISISPA